MTVRSLIAVVFCAATANVEGAGSAGAGQAAGLSTGRPHIVIFMTGADDQLDLEQFHLNPTEPSDDIPSSLTSLAKEGVTFTHAFLCSSTDAIGQFSFFRGRPPRWFAAHDEAPVEEGSEQRSNPKSLHEHLVNLGYRTMCIGQPPDAFGDLFGVEVVLWSELESDNLTAASSAMTGWLQASMQADKRPIFLLVHGSDDNGTAQRSKGSENQSSPARLPLERRLSEVMRATDAAFATDDSIFVFTRSTASKPGNGTQALTDESIHIPLVLRWDGQMEAGGVSEAMISSVDFLPTLVELAGGTPPSDVDGLSFAGILRGEETEHRDAIFAFALPDLEVSEPKASSESNQASVESPQEARMETMVRQRRFSYLRSLIVPWRRNQRATDAGEWSVEREQLVDHSKRPVAGPVDHRQNRFRAALTELRQRLDSWQSQHRRLTR